MCFGRLSKRKILSMKAQGIPVLTPARRLTMRWDELCANSKTLLGQNLRSAGQNGPG